MTAFTNYAETLVMTWLFTASAATRPTTWFTALHTADPTEVGNVGELSGNGYARQSTAFTIAANEASNTATLTFGPNTGSNWGTVSHVSVWDAVSTGNCLAYGALSSSVVIAVGDSLTIAAGALDITLN
jgi:hypothetical protein